MQSYALYIIHATVAAWPETKKEKKYGGVITFGEALYVEYT